MSKEYYLLNEQLGARASKIYQILRQQERECDRLGDFISKTMHDKCGEDPAEDNASTMYSVSWKIHEAIETIKTLVIADPLPSGYRPLIKKEEE